ncbi:MAG TPA: hypothetical protein VJ876_04885 [Bacteroidales bacterium]|nr:hypothetical protein [Bacteroidales bacterium]
MKTIKQYAFIATMAALIVGLGFSFNGCKQSQKDQGEGDQQAQGEKITKSEIKQDVSEMVYPLPSNFEITETLNEIGASFIISLSSDIENVNKYVTEDRQALNLGVYSADLSYATTYNMKQYTMDYMDVTKQLVQELGITGAYSPDFIEQIKSNFDNKDRLVDMVTNSFYNTYKFMQQQGKDELSVLVVAGTWIEAMYITTHVSENTFHNKQIVDLIREQKKSLKKLIDLLKPFNENQSVSMVLEGLQPIYKVYQNRSEDGFTQKQVQKIQNLTGEIRNKIIS